MSIAFEHGAYKQAPGIAAGGAREAEEASSSSTSSIGRDSDGSAGPGGSAAVEAEEEVESAYKGPLDSLDALEESLPIKRGISNFYTGKSKSFTSLADAMSSVSSAKDLSKPESPYTRKRKNLLDYKNIWERPHGNHLKFPEGSISKKPAGSTRSALSIATITISSSGSKNNSSGEEQNEVRHLPPLYPPLKPTRASASQRTSLQVRSYSMIDLQGMGGS